MESVQLTDQQSAAVVKSPSTRVSLADIEANIAAEYFMRGTAAMPDEISEREVLAHGALSVLTVCVIVMRNGFTVIGKAAPADPTNFNPELGRKFAREDAIRQIWPLMGYALRDRLVQDDPAREIRRVLPWPRLEKPNQAPTAETFAGYQAALDRILEIADSSGRRIETAMDGCDRIVTIAKAARGAD